MIMIVAGFEEPDPCEEATADGDIDDLEDIDEGDADFAALEDRAAAVLDDDPQAVSADSPSRAAAVAAARRVPGAIRRPSGSGAGDE
jgi:hypothetical protein